MVHITDRWSMLVAFLVGVDDGKDLQALGVGSSWLVGMMPEERSQIVQAIRALIGAVVGGVHLDHIAAAEGDCSLLEAARRAAIASAKA
jgi:hypothetical protein